MYFFFKKTKKSFAKFGVFPTCHRVRPVLCDHDGPLPDVPPEPQLVQHLQGDQVGAAGVGVPAEVPGEEIMYKQTVGFPIMLLKTSR